MKKISAKHEKNIGETNLEQLIAKLEPVLNEGEYVFTSVSNGASIPRNMPICTFKEQEGMTLVLPKAEADKLGLSYDYIAAWITLNVHSSLAAVGLTAAFATALSQHQISANVIAGYYHDHIFVAKNDQAKALEVLRALSKNV